MMLCIDRYLHVVANYARTASARSHRATVRIRQRDLLIRGGQHLLLVGRQLPHLLLKLNQFLLQMRRLRRKRFRWFLPVGRVELSEIARNAVFKLHAPPLDFPPREVLVARVDRLELATVDGHAWAVQKAHLPTQHHELRADLFDRRPIVVRAEPPQQPDHFQVAAGFAFQPSARRHAIEIAVDIELQQYRRVVRGPPRCLWNNAVKAELNEIEPINEHINGANRIALVDPIIEAFRQQRRLLAIGSLNEPLHRLSRQNVRKHITDSTFLRSQGQRPRPRAPEDLQSVSAVPQLTAMPRIDTHNAGFVPITVISKSQISRVSSPDGR